MKRLITCLFLLSSAMFADVTNVITFQFGGTQLPGVPFVTDAVFTGVIVGTNDPENTVLRITVTSPNGQTETRLAQVQYNGYATVYFDGPIVGLPVVEEVHGHSR